MILFIGQNLTEDYDTVKRVLNLLDVKLSVATSCDLKLMMILLGKCIYIYAWCIPCNLSNYSLLVGLQSNSSRHGCPWCTITTRNNCPGAFSSGPNLSPNERESEMLFYKKENPKKPKETIVVPRTLGQIKKLAELWQELGQNKYEFCSKAHMNQSKNYFNCVELPLLPGMYLVYWVDSLFYNIHSISTHIGPPDEPLVHWLPMSSLHFFLGGLFGAVFNWIFYDWKLLIWILGMGNKIYDELQTLTVPLYANRTMEHTAYGWGFFNNINPEKYWGKKVHFYIYICVTFKTMPHSSFK